MADIKVINITSYILVLALLLSLSSAAYASTEDNGSTQYTEGTLYYIIEDNSVTITGCFGHDAEVYIPSAIAGTPVNTIASGAFTSNRYVKIIHIPDTVTTIEEGAFGDVTLVFSWGTVSRVGDVNQDGYINVIDCSLIRSYALGLEELTDSQKSVADVNGDGRINVVDVNLVRRFTAGMITEFPVS